MCLAASYWARLDAIYYGCSAADAARAGFDDAFLYEEFRKDQAARSLPVDATLRRRGLGQLCGMDRFAQQDQVLIGRNPLIRTIPRHATATIPIAQPASCFNVKDSHVLRWEWSQHAPSCSMFHHPGLQRRARH